MRGTIFFKSSTNVLRALCCAIFLLAFVWLGGCGGSLGHLGAGGGGGGVDFTISLAPGSQSVVAGNGAGFSVVFNPPAMVGFANFSVSGLPPGTEAAFAPGFDVTRGAKSL